MPPDSFWDVDVVGPFAQGQHSPFVGPIRVKKLYRPTDRTKAKFEKVWTLNELLCEEDGGKNYLGKGLVVY